MNNTVILVVGLVVVVLLFSKRPATTTAANGAPTGTGTSNAAPKDQTLSLIDDIVTALQKTADAVKAGVQRN